MYLKVPVNNLNSVVKNDLRIGDKGFVFVGLRVVLSCLVRGLGGGSQKQSG